MSELQQAIAAVMAGVQVKAKALAELVARPKKLPVMQAARLLLDAQAAENQLDGHLAALSADARRGATIGQ